MVVVVVVVERGEVRVRVPTLRFWLVLSTGQKVKVLLIGPIIRCPKNYFQLLLYLSVDGVVWTYISCVC